MTEETQTSLSAPWKVSFHSSPFKLFLLDLELQRWSVEISPQSSRVASFLNKTTFPFHPTLVSPAFAFKRPVVELGILGNIFSLIYQIEPLL